MSQNASKGFRAVAMSMSEVAWIAAALACKGLVGTDAERREIGINAYCLAQAGTPLPLLAVAKL